MLSLWCDDISGLCCFQFISESTIEQPKDSLKTLTRHEIKMLTEKPIFMMQQEQGTTAGFFFCGRFDRSALYTVTKHISGPVGMQLVTQHYSILVTYCTWSKKLQRFPLLQYALQYHNTFSVCPCGRQTPNLYSLQCEGQLTELYHHELFLLLKMFFSVHSVLHTNIFNSVHWSKTIWWKKIYSIYIY